MKDHANRQSAGLRALRPERFSEKGRSGLVVGILPLGRHAGPRTGIPPAAMDLDPTAAFRAASASSLSLWKAIMRRAVLSLVWVCTVLAHPFSHADVVADWNRIALDMVVQSGQRLEYQLNTMAIVNVAMFEAVNFVRGRYRPRFVVGSHEIHGVSMDAVAAAAAHHILVNSYPNQEAALDTALRASLDALPADHARASGIIAGASIAAGIRAVTSSKEGAGELSREGASSAPPALRQDAIAARLKYWLPETAGQFHPTAPATPDGALLTRVHFSSHANPLSLNRIVTELIAVKALALDESARIHALASIVAADAYLIAVDTPNRCALCVAAASVAYILASEVRAGGSESKTFNTDREIGRAIARSALRQYYRPVGEP